MQYQQMNVTEGITLHTIPTKKFKTNLLSIFLTLPLEREQVTKYALISSVLRRGCKAYPTSEAISIALEEMYGAAFDCGIEKMGDHQILKFYLETIQDEFLPEKENILQKALDLLVAIVLDPALEKGSFLKNYVSAEKENLSQMIEGKVDQKARYALDRCIEEMYHDKPYGLYKYGYVEDLENIDEVQLYKDYQTMIKQAKIDIFVSGDTSEKEVKAILENNSCIQALSKRTPAKDSQAILQAIDKPNQVQESMDITQGKLVMGYTIQKQTNEQQYATLVYNTILGGGANSKLFQNVREKASLAYTAGSNYIRQKHNILIRCGIEIQNYQKAVDIIKKQVEDMKQGNFSSQELENAKTAIIATIDFIPDEQDTQISYYFGQELMGSNVSIDEYKQKIQQITKEQVMKVAQNVSLHTIYFLTNEKGVSACK